MPKANYGSGATGALSGAATGAALGSVVPGIGTAVGAIGGGLLGGITGLFGGGKKQKTKQASLQTKEQRELSRLINQGLKGKGEFASLFGEFNPDKFEEGVSKPALKMFEEETLPQLQEKFIAGNQVLGSGRQRAEGKAKTDFMSELAKLRYEAEEKQKANRIAGLQIGAGGGKVENIIQPGSPSAGQEMVKSLGENSKLYVDAIKSHYDNKDKEPAKPDVTPAATSATAGGV